MFRDTEQRFINRRLWRLYTGVNKRPFIMYEPNQYYLALRKWR